MKNFTLVTYIHITFAIPFAKDAIRTRKCSHQCNAKFSHTLLTYTEQRFASSPVPRNFSQYLPFSAPRAINNSFRPGIHFSNVILLGDGFHSSFHTDHSIQVYFRGQKRYLNDVMSLWNPTNRVDIVIIFCNLILSQGMVTLRASNAEMTFTFMTFMSLVTVANKWVSVVSFQVVQLQSYVINCLQKIESVG